MRIGAGCGERSGRFPEASVSASRFYRHLNDNDITAIPDGFLKDASKLEWLSVKLRSLERIGNPALTDVFVASLIFSHY